jgi:hypothetical protein
MGFEAVMAKSAPDCTVRALLVAAAKFVSPEYAAVRVCVPSEIELVEYLATPMLFRGAAVPEPPSTLKLTVPVGRAEPDVGMIAAMKVLEMP